MRIVLSGDKFSARTTVGLFASDFIRSAYEGVLGREPDPEGMEVYRQALSSSGDLTGVLAELVSSDELMEKNFAAARPELIKAVYEALLKREADETGLADYSNLMKKPADLAAVIGQIMSSEEYRELMSGEAKEVELDPLTDFAGHVNDIYLRYLARPVSKTELAGHLAADKKIYEVMKEVAAPGITRRGVVRVLLFGAYGNGNLGDAYQALALRAHLMARWGLSSGSIFSCSLLDVHDYPFPDSQKLPPDSIFDYDLVNSFDYLIIGGGGLLDHPHEPLSRASWASRVRVPVLLLGIGVTPIHEGGLDTASRHERLLERALFVSTRDRESAEALGHIRRDAVLARDPILCLSDMNSILEFDEEAEGDIEEAEVLWILKYPSSPEDEEILGRIDGLIRRDKKRRHAVLALEPMLDREMERFVHSPVHYLTSSAELMRYLKKAKAVFSMRYHGVVFALKAGCPLVYGFSKNKIKALLFELGVRDRFLREPGDFRHALLNMDKMRQRSVKRLAGIGGEFGRTLESFRLPGVKKERRCEASRLSYVF